MYTTETHSQFIELRARGCSLSKIAGGASVPVSRTAPIRVSMASHRRFEERPLKSMTAKFTHIRRGLFPLPRGCGDEVSRAQQHIQETRQGEGQTGTSVFTVLTERGNRS